ncbi:MAG TPA: acyltransferase [Propionibacterium sp.]|nr:acyltransferase [Propionibacterium sp.]
MEEPTIRVNRGSNEPTIRVDRGRRKSKHRGEIHGLRGLAIALVVAYHLWGAGRVSGGVDVFLMISAYLMTASFLRQGMAFKILDFLVGRFRRLIPSSAVVILSVCVAGWLILPPTRWYPLLDQALASLFYNQNWVLIDLATDYTSPDRSGTSLLQHYWSLSIQGQIFVLWPLLMLVAMGLFKLTRTPIKASLGVIFSAITIASFIYAQRAVADNPSRAYFDTYARVWEFSLAALFAFVPVLRLPFVVSAAMSWIGVIAIGVGGLIIGRYDFPGVVALWPSLAAALVVFAGGSTHRAHAAYWLSSKPLAWIGDRAYGLYLWHWPVLMFWLYLSGRNEVDLLGSVGVIGLSILLADLSTRTIERRFNALPLLKSKRWGLAATATILIIVFGTVQFWTNILDRGVRAVNETPETERPGALAVTPGAALPTSTPSRSIAPGDPVIGTDWPEALPPCGEDLDPQPPESECSEIRPQGPPHKTVVIMGDSHANQWNPLMADLANREQWHLLVIIKPGCRFTLENTASSEECIEYSRAMTDYLLEIQPDFVFTVGTRAQADGPELPVESYADAARPLTEAGIRIVNMRDNPRFSFKMPECVQRYGAAHPRCLRPVEEKLAPVSPQLALETDPGMLTMDLTDFICPAGWCSPVIGNVYVYMDDNHLSRTYIHTLKAEFEAQLWRVIDR